MSTTEHIEDFVHTIALECDALEMAMFSDTQAFHSSANLLGKSWYAVGLESNEKEVQQDNANKGGIVKRMIDSIISFIKRIVERIRAFFSKTDKKKVEETAEFAKHYSSPSDEAFIKAVDEFARQAQGSADRARAATKVHKAGQAASDSLKATNDSMTSANKSAQAASNSMQGAIDKLSEELGKKATKADVEEVFVNEKVKKAQSRLGADGVTLVVAAANPSFHARFKEGIKLLEELSQDGDVYKMIHNRQKYAKLDEHTRYMKDIIGDAQHADEKANLEVLGKWVMNTDHLISTQATGYILGGMDLIFSEAFMISAAKRLEAYKNETHDSGAVDNVKEIQKCVAAFTNFFTLAMNVHTRATSLVEIVRS